MANDFVTKEASAECTERAFLRNLGSRLYNVSCVKCYNPQVITLRPFQIHMYMGNINTSPLYNHKFHGLGLRSCFSMWRGGCLFEYEKSKN